MSNENFFQESSEQSKIKSLIVSKYFWAWARVIISTAKKNGRKPKLAYIDLFAGPGRYKDGTKSTPIIILEKTVADFDLKEGLVTIFNDADKQFSSSLEEAINSIPEINKLKFKPKIYNNEVGEQIVKMFKEMKFIPTLFFVDPWGYKGLSLQLINSILKNWGCDCIFFFNYNRINMGLGNEVVKEHMDALFGDERAKKLRQKLDSFNPEERELLILEELSSALIEMGGVYTLPFVFKNEKGTRTSHHLIFVSKAFKGYEIMKEIMANESSLSEQGVASFGYNPADIKTPLLFELSRPIDDLKDTLMSEFAGKEMTMNEIYLSHSVNKPYIARNYKTVLKRLEEEEKIEVIPPAAKRKKIKGEISFGPNVKVKFPKQV